MPQLPEILAPAGNFEQLYAAVRCGANAVYMGGNSFNARRGAGNFDNIQLAQAVQYCHAADVKCYLALNTLVCDDELPAAIGQAEYACQIGMDAIIVQDLGLASVIRNCAPDMPLHASTQCSAHTPSAVQQLSQSGFSRVIAARECSKAEIAAMVNTNEAEIEIFVHGALCMSVSGQCYMSGMFGARSGNRGLCAQPCRLPFNAPDGCANALSLKDLSLIKHISEIAQIGVHSIKIEGRLKRPEYVAAAVTACKSAITDGKCDDELLNNLQSVFSRSGFTDGYFTDSISRSMFGIRRREDVTAASSVLPGFARLFDKEKPLIPIDMTFSMKADVPAEISIDDGVNNITVSGEVPQTAINRPLDNERIIAQLKKTGSTIYYANQIKVDSDDGLTMPISELNRMRRQATDELTTVRSLAAPIQFDATQAMINQPISPASSLSSLNARFGNIQSLRLDNDYFKKLTCFDTIYISADTLDSKIEQFAELCRLHGITPAIELPRAMFGLDEHYLTRLNAAKSMGIEHCLVNNIGALELAAKCKMIPCGGFGLNVTNRSTLEELSLCGLDNAVLSFELSLARINKMNGIMPIGVIIYGHLPLMLTRNCPIGGDCRSCKKQGSITDRKGMTMPVMCSKAGREILNPIPLYMADRLNEIKADFGVMYFTTETADEALDIIGSYIQHKPAPSKITRGLYYRTLE